MADNDNLAKEVRTQDSLWRTAFSLTWLLIAATVVITIAGVIWIGTLD